MPIADALRKLEEFGDSPGNAPPPPHTFIESPNRGAREYDPIDTVVIHATAGSSTQGAVSWFKNPQSGASAHVIIPDNERVGEPPLSICMVRNEDKAWHVRRSVRFPSDGQDDTNSRSLGIEIVNTGQTDDTFSDWQVAEAARWVQYWRGLFPIRYVCTHAFLDPARRRDPGSNFPWERFLTLVRKSGIEGGDRVEPAIPPEVVALGEIIDIDAELLDGVEGQRDIIRGDVELLVRKLGFDYTFDTVNHRVEIRRRG
jgi:N-acetyl-anhydromuramyl-L-alanine amidase AmpD